MVACMTQIAKLHINFTVQERLLFSVANKSVLAPKRQSLRLLEAVETGEEKTKQNSHVVLTRKLKVTIKSEISSFLDQELALIQNDILPFQTEVDGQVFFLKLFVLLLIPFLHKSTVLLDPNFCMYVAEYL